MSVTDGEVVVTFILGNIKLIAMRFSDVVFNSTEQESFVRT